MVVGLVAVTGSGVGLPVGDRSRREGPVGSKEGDPCAHSRDKVRGSRTKEVPFLPAVEFPRFRPRTHLFFSFFFL